MFKTLSKFEKYDTKNENKKLVLFSNFYLPIEFIKTSNYEYKNQDITYTEEDLKAIGTQKLQEELENEIQHKENIINKQVNIYGNEEYIEVEVIYEVLEDIGTESEILF